MATPSYPNYYPNYGPRPIGAANLHPAPVPIVATYAAQGNGVPVRANLVPAQAAISRTVTFVNPLVTQKQTYEFFHIDDGNINAVDPT